METLLPNPVICGLKLMTRSTLQIPTLFQEQPAPSGKVCAGPFSGAQRAPPSAGGHPGSRGCALCCRSPHHSCCAAAPRPPGAGPGRVGGGCGAGRGRVPAGRGARPPPAQPERQPRADPCGRRRCRWRARAGNKVAAGAERGASGAGGGGARREGDGRQRGREDEPEFQQISDSAVSGVQRGGSEE